MTLRMKSRLQGRFCCGARQKVTKMAKENGKSILPISDEILGKITQEVMSSGAVTGAIKTAMDARERATKAQEVTLNLLNLPSAADLERLTRRVRNVSQRLEGIEDSLDRVDERVTNLGSKTATQPATEGASDASLQAIDERLNAIEQSLKALLERGVN